MGHKTDHWMITDHISVQCIELLHRGARATGVCMGICSWAVTQSGVGKGYLI